MKLWVLFIFSKIKNDFLLLIIFYFCKTIRISILFIQWDIIWKRILLLSYRNSYTFCSVKHHAGNDMQQKIDKSFHPILVLTRTSYSAIKLFAHLQFDFLVLASYLERLYFDKNFITSKTKYDDDMILFMSIKLLSFAEHFWNNKWSSILKL